MTDPASPDPAAVADDLNTAEREVNIRLQKIETMLGTGTQEAIDAVMREVESLKGELELEPLASSAPVMQLRAAVLTAEGHAVRILGRLADSVARYEEALQLLEAAPEGERKSRQAANLWTCRGVAQLAMNDPEAPERALASFDEAIAIRNRTEQPRSTADQWGLAANWLNRADALAFLGGAPRLAEAIEATRAAREALAALDTVDDPSFCVHHALTWMRESELSARRWIEFRSGAKDGICEGFHRAVEILRPAAEEDRGEARRVLAAVLTNLSRTRLYIGEAGSSEGEAEALEALDRVGDAEERFVEAALLATTARLTASLHVANSPQWHDRAIEITDLVEEGLAVVAKWRKAGVGLAFDEELVAELLGLGAEGYLAAAPHFLNDFLLDQLDPERSDDHFSDLGACHEVAMRVLGKGISLIQDRGFTDMGGDEYESRRELLVVWEQCGERLAEVRRD